MNAVLRSLRRLQSKLNVCLCSSGATGAFRLTTNEEGDTWSLWHPQNSQQETKVLFLLRFMGYLLTCKPTLPFGLFTIYCCGARHLTFHSWLFLDNIKSHIFQWEFLHSFILTRPGSGEKSWHALLEWKAKHFFKITFFLALS